MLNGAALYAAPHPESPDVRALLPPRVGVPGGKDGRHARGPYHLEIIFGGAVFWLIGGARPGGRKSPPLLSTGPARAGKVDCTSYISTYVRQTGVVAASKASLSVLVLWIAITVGRLVGLQDQINLKKQPTRAIFAHLAAWLLTGTVGMFATAVFPAQPWAFWTGVALYGLGNGPCVGYCYDLVNRMTVATEEGMSIVMFGLNFGASLVPYLTTVIWDYTSSGPGVLIWVTLLSMFIPMPLLVAAAMVGKVD